MSLKMSALKNRTSRRGQGPVMPVADGLEYVTA